MKFSLSWLRTHLETAAPLSVITETLSAIGLEVEGVADAGAPLAAFRIARVIEAVAHPNADRLRVCRVETGDGEVAVVCGAPNARTGMRAVFAPPGSVIPATGAVLKIGEIRGVKSHGMLLSAREMGLGTDHDGIVELPQDAPVGVPYAAWAGLDDPVIEIAVTPNRGDALSVRGVARDLAAAGLGELRPWEPAPVAGGFASGIVWRNEWPEACPWVLGREIRGVRNGASPAWLQNRLRSIGLRPISTLVDITNFFTHDLGRPLHVFDADRIAGGTLILRPGAQESFRALTGRDVVAGPEDLVIADAAGVQSLAGIVGGEASASGADTTRCFIECALFDPIRIARTGRRLRIASDARARFERGVDTHALPALLEAATRLVLDFCGGEAGGVVAAGAEPGWQRQARLRFARIESFGGAVVPQDEVVQSLERLGLRAVARDAASVCVSVPPWRSDIAASPVLDPAPGLPADRAAAAAAAVAALEAESDLIEEVLRLRGMDLVPAVCLPPMAGVVASPVPAAALSAAQSRVQLLRRVLAQRGLAECVTYSFMAARVADGFGSGVSGTAAALTLLNPIAADLDRMRPTPLATLAQAAARNAARGEPAVALFEIGPAFSGDAAAPGGGQTLVASALRAGTPPRRWNGQASAPDAMTAKADLWAVLAAAGVPMESLSVTVDAPVWYHPGQSGVVRQGRTLTLGQFGVLHPSVSLLCGIDGPVCGMEVFLDRLPAPRRRARPAPVLEPLQTVRRDFAFIVPAGIAAERVVRAARGADRTAIVAVRLFDVFEGGGLAPGMRSLGVEVVFQPRFASFTDEDLEKLNHKVIDAVARATGAALR